MQNLRETLKDRLKEARRLAILGIGSDLRGDDVAGLLVAKHLEGHRAAIDSDMELKVFYGSAAPDNVTGEIKKFRPTHLVVVDSTDAGDEPGAVTFIEPGRERGASFCTHRLPARLITAYLKKFLECEILIIGIRPKVLDFCRCPSKEVTASARRISDAIKEAIR